MYRSRPLSRLGLLALMLAAIVAVGLGCSPESGDDAEPTSRDSMERVVDPPRQEAASAGRLRPDPHEAKFDKGRMFDDGCIVKGEDTNARGCFYGRPDADVTVVLVGDSHALQYGPAMISIAERRGWRLLALARADCVIAAVDFNPRCSEWRRRAMKRIRRVEPDMVVVSASTGSQFRVKQAGRTLSRRASEPLLRAGMAKSMRQLSRFESKRGKRTKVVLLRDQPLAPFRPPDCLKKEVHQRNPSKCGFKADRAEQTAFDFHGARRVEAVQVVDPIRLLCPKGWCRVVENGMIIYRDRYHYTATWAETIAPWLERRLGEPH